MAENGATIQATKASIFIINNNHTGYKVKMLPKYHEGIFICMPRIFQ